ncbi:hypothetical protein ACUN9V_13305 [Salinicola sp. V024]|uniref:hypothetical protein n=1 Tax=Salinicola sp. V024 TaxID=3459609 RepID=UPI0040447FF0
MRDYGLLASSVEELDQLDVGKAVQAGRDWAKAEGTGSSDNPIAQWQAWHEDIPRLRESYERGNPRALLNALELCAIRGLPMPEWCRSAYLECWRKAKEYRCRTLDEAFGHEVKGTNLARAREKYQHSMAVAISVAREIGRGATVEVAIQSVADEFNICFSRSREWYYAFRRIDHPAIMCFLPAESENSRKD